MELSLRHSPETEEDCAGEGGGQNRSQSQGHVLRNASSRDFMIGVLRTMLPAAFLLGFGDCLRQLRLTLDSLCSLDDFELPIFLLSPDECSQVLRSEAGTTTPSGGTIFWGPPSYMSVTADGS